MTLRTRAYPDQTLFCQVLFALACCPRHGVRDLAARLLARAVRTNV